MRGVPAQFGLFRVDARHRALLPNVGRRREAVVRLGPAGPLLMARTVAVDATEKAAYLIDCPVEDCLAAPGQDCTNPNRQGEAIVQPWAHMRRVWAAEKE